MSEFYFSESFTFYILILSLVNQEQFYGKMTKPKLYSTMNKEKIKNILLFLKLNQENIQHFENRFWVPKKYLL